ncbi:MAG: hypothetical protein SWX82_33225 [Cyanobacteriota bacterium]|nr:hypothetical protein [Cyanobacteriota bacterium]
MLQIEVQNVVQKSKFEVSYGGSTKHRPTLKGYKKYLGFAYGKSFCSL